MPSRPCREPGCPNLVRKGRCRLHTKMHTERRRSSVARQVYTDPRWLACRERAIKRAGGRCQGVEANRTRCAATSRLHGHHNYPGGVEQMVADGISPFDEELVVVLCGRHHRSAEAAARNPSFRR
jgi:hypothetical protein